MDTCPSFNQMWLYAAINVAQGFAHNAYEYLDNIPSSKDLYTTWFGQFTESRKNIVRDRFKLIDSNQFSAYTYDCSCTKPTAFAYVRAYIFQS